MRFLLTVVQRIVQVVNLDAAVIKIALRPDSDFKDIEDAMQNESAMRVGCEAIITRDPDGFTAANIPVMSAAEYLKLL